MKIFTPSASAQWLRSLLLLSTTLLISCDPFSGGAIFLDCIDDDGPVLNPKTLPTPVLNQSYEAIIQASIDNEPYDDRFHYRFNIGSGLPQGLIVNTFEREVRITGAPVVLGDYGIRIEVAVEDGSGGNAQSRLCRTKAARNYVFNVQATNPANPQ